MKAIDGVVRLPSGRDPDEIVLVPIRVQHPDGSIDAITLHLRVGQIVPRAMASEKEPHRSANGLSSMSVTMSDPPTEWRWPNNGPWYDDPYDGRDTRAAWTFQVFWPGIATPLPEWGVPMVVEVK